MLHTKLPIIDPSLSEALRALLVLVGMGVLGKRQKREEWKEARYGCSEKESFMGM